MELAGVGFIDENGGGPRLHVRRAEVSESESSTTAVNDLTVRRALELAGVEFIDDNSHHEFFSRHIIDVANH